MRKKWTALLLALMLTLSPAPLRTMAEFSSQATAEAADSEASLETVSTTGSALCVTLAILPDRTPPGEVRDAAVAAGDRSLTVTWIDPTDPDLEAVKVVCGEIVRYVEPGVESAVFPGLVPGSVCRIRLSTLDASGNLSAGFSLSGSPEDLTPPSPVEGLTAARTDSGWTLSWTDPTDADLNSIQIRGDGCVFRVDGGVQTAAVPAPANDPCTYEAVAEDLFGNRSTAATVLLTADRTVQAGIGLPGETTPGSTVNVSPLLSCSRTDVYAVELHVTYDSSLFRFESAEAASGTNLARCETTTPGALSCLVWSDSPIRGDRISLATLVFRALAPAVTESGLFAITDATAGTAPDGGTIDAGTASGSVAIVVPEPVDGDVNGDSRTTLADLALIVYHYGAESGDANWADAARMDIAGPDGRPDGRVDVLDLAHVALLLQ